MKRLPLEPLVNAYGRPWREFREVVGARHTVLSRAKSEGLTLEEADRFATKCGYHPAEIWGFETWVRANEK